MLCDSMQAVPCQLKCNKSITFIVLSFLIQAPLTNSTSFPQISALLPSFLTCIFIFSVPSGYVSWAKQDVQKMFPDAPCSFLRSCSPDMAYNCLSDDSMPVMTNCIQSQTARCGSMCNPWITTELLDPIRDFSFKKANKSKSFLDLDKYTMINQKVINLHKCTRRILYKELLTENTCYPKIFKEHIPF